MKFKNINNWIRGLFENEGHEARINDNFLTKLHNADVDITGRAKRRYGYEYWLDLLHCNSVPATIGGENFPDFTGKFGFKGKIQAMFQYVDVGGEHYFIVIVEGKIFIETMEGAYKTWSCLNPPNTSGESPYPFEEKSKRIGIAYYLDKLFFNDVGTDVFIYNSYERYSKGFNVKTNILTTPLSRVIYFSDNKVYLYNLDMTVDADVPTYTFASGGNQEQQVLWTTMLNYKSATVNYYESLHFGYCKYINGYYYILDNAKNQRTVAGSKTNRFQIVCLGKDLNYVSYLDFGLYNELGVNTEIINFDYHDGHIYIFVNDGLIKKIPIPATGNFGNATTIGGESASLKAPKVNNTKQYSIAANIKGIFVYTYTLPTRADWYQPIFSNKLPGDGRSIVEGTVYLPESLVWQIGPYWFKVRAGPNGPILTELMSSSILDDAKTWIRTNEIVVTRSIFQNGWGTPKIYYCNQITETLNYALNVGSQLYPISWRKDNWRYRTWDDPFSSWDGGFFNAPFGPSEIKAISENFKADLHNLLQYYDTRFHRDKDGMSLLPIEPLSYSYILPPNWQYITVAPRTNMYYLIGSDFNPIIFSSRNISKYVLVVRLDFSGNLFNKTVPSCDDGNKTWRFILPISKMSDTIQLIPLLTYEEISNAATLADGQRHLCFGADMTPGAIGRQGQSHIIDVEDFWNSSWLITSAGEYKTISSIGLIMNSAHDSNNYKKVPPGTSNILYNYKIDAGITFTLPSNFRESYSCFVPYIRTLKTYTYSVQDVDAVVDPDIYALKRLGAPKIPPVTAVEAVSTFVDMSEVRYYVAFEYYNGQITGLSEPSANITMPSTVPPYSLSTYKVIISDLNLKNVSDIPLYLKEDINKINVYREDRFLTGTTYGSWAQIYLVGQLEKNGEDDWQSGSFPIETYEDTQGYIAGNEPLDKSKIISFRCSDMFVHKNRLLLVNLLDQDNQNLVQYSEVDLAESMSPANIRPIQSGDGDYLVGGLSVADYAYLFKSRKIYAILGDVPTGQLIDVDRKIGTVNKYLIVFFENKIYFLSESGIYRITGIQIENLMQERVRNYFDKQRDDSIDFESDAFIYDAKADIDIEKREITWYLPQKRKGQPRINNFAIVYSIDYDYFKTREYGHNIIDAAYIKNLSGGHEYLLGDYDGNIYQINKSKNDDGKSVRWVIKTKELNMGTDNFNNIFKMIKVAGRYLKDIRITYWIDGERYTGILSYREGISEVQSAFIKIWSRGTAKRIAIEVSGEDSNEIPVDIEEILIGYEKARSFR